MAGADIDAEVGCYAVSRVRKCSRFTGDSVVTGDWRRVRRVVTVDAVVTADRKRVRPLITEDAMVMGDGVVTGDTMVTGTGQHGCRSGHS